MRHTARLKNGCPIHVGVALWEHSQYSISVNVENRSMVTFPYECKISKFTNQSHKEDRTDDATSMMTYSLKSLSPIYLICKNSSS